MSVLQDLLDKTDVFFRPIRQYNNQVKKELKKDSSDYKKRIDSIKKCENIESIVKNIVKKTYNFISKPKFTPTEIRIYKNKITEMKNEKTNKMIEQRKKELIKVLDKKMTIKKFIDNNLHKSIFTNNEKRHKGVGHLRNFIEYFNNKKIFKNQIKTKTDEKKLQDTARRIVYIQRKYVPLVNESFKYIKKNYMDKIQKGGNLYCSIDLKK